MSDLIYKLPKTQVFFDSEIVENIVISALTLIFITLASNIALIVLRHRGEEKEVQLSTYFDAIAYAEFFRPRTWSALFRPRPELESDHDDTVPGNPPRGIANRRMIKAFLLHLLLAGLEFVILLLFSKETQPLTSEQVGVVAKYVPDGLTKIPMGNCIISTPQKRREQLKGIFLTCYEISESIPGENPGTVTFAMEKLQSGLRMGFGVGESTITSTISFTYSFGEQLDVKLDSDVTARVVTAITEGISLTGCSLEGNDISNAQFVGCTSLNISDISSKVASTVGYTGGNYTLGTAAEGASVFEEAVGVEIGAYTGTLIDLFYLPIVVGVCTLIFLFVSIVLTADPQRVINVALMEEVPTVQSSWGYLFVGQGSVKATKDQSADGTRGHIGVDNAME